MFEADALSTEQPLRLGVRVRARVYVCACACAHACAPAETGRLLHCDVLPSGVGKGSTRRPATAAAGAQSVPSASAQTTREQSQTPPCKRSGTQSHCGGHATQPRPMSAAARAHTHSANL